MVKKARKFSLEMTVSDNLAQKLSRGKILLDDLVDVIEFCERTGRRVFHPKRASYSGYQEKGYMTLWVEYKIVQDAEVVELIGAYAHRMKIELETVWNGKKVIADI